MNTKHNGKLVENSRRLRREMTSEERHLWYDFLKKLPLTVRRQKIIGNYIADFYIANVKLVIEIDGSQHYEDKNSDLARDAYMNELGLRVVRYSNYDVNSHFDVVCADIWNQLGLDER